MTRSQALRLAQILAPSAPHVAEELWSRLGGEDLLAYAAWPEVDESLLVEDSVELAVQILGMDCARVTVSAGSGKDAILTAARQAVADQLAGKKVVKEIVVPVRLVNFVAK